MGKIEIPYLTFFCQISCSLCVVQEKNGVFGGNVLGGRYRSQPYIQYKIVFPTHPFGPLQYALSAVKIHDHVNSHSYYQLQEVPHKHNVLRS